MNSWLLQTFHKLFLPALRDEGTRGLVRVPGRSSDVAAVPWSRDGRIARTGKSVRFLAHVY